ncbi:MAG: transcriptional regulator [Pseudooceanicola sp.]|jgi:transcriptional regulator with XRE-family HTH domain|nr:transcriptional regulator [Pseudooceanicola sp.]
MDGVTSKRDTVALFRARLTQLFERRQQSKSAFAKRCGLDRSALSQFMNPANLRLPRAESIQKIAQAEGVSIDWLLGMNANADLAENPPSLLMVDKHRIGATNSPIATWYREAAGYKVRYVPTSLPNLLRSDEICEFEFRDATTTEKSDHLRHSEYQIAHIREGATDLETILPIQNLLNLAHGTDIWRDLPAHARRTQLIFMAELIDSLYPRFRLFLYDGRPDYCAPRTIFGPAFAVLFLGEGYAVLKSQKQVQTLTRQFDNLIRKAVVTPDRVASWLTDLAQEIPR